MQSQPAKNDVVVRHKRGGGREHYVIRTPAGPDQLQIFGRDKAIAHALAFAEFARLSAWICDDAMGPVLLASFRDEVPVVVMATERQWHPVAI
jgi:hypothetical protein